MRITFLVFWIILVSMAYLEAQSNGPDPYSIEAVKFELQMRSEQRIKHSWGQKRLHRLGDCTAVALLKLLDERELIDTDKIRDFLPMIRESFDQPQLIETTIDRSPRVTLFLLQSIMQNVSDTAVQNQIQDTIDFVRGKTTNTGATNP
jgi:hypothetical protein